MDLDNDRTAYTDSLNRNTFPTDPRSYWTDQQRNKYWQPSTLDSVPSNWWAVRTGEFFVKMHTSRAGYPPLHARVQLKRETSTGELVVVHGVIVDVDLQLDDRGRPRSKVCCKVCIEFTY